MITKHFKHFTLLNLKNKTALIIQYQYLFESFTVRNRTTNYEQITMWGSPRY